MGESNSLNTVKTIAGAVAYVATVAAVGVILGPQVAAEEGGKKLLAGAGAALIGMCAGKQVKKMVRNDIDAYAVIAAKIAEKAQQQAQMSPA